MLLCHFKFSFKEDKLNFRFIGTLSVELTNRLHLCTVITDDVKGAKNKKVRHMTKSSGVTVVLYML